MVLVLIFGLIIGSFISAFTYRLPRGRNISQGRSECTRCKKTIRWYDNIPVLSYIFLRGRCRNCHKSISMRYPVIELLTATIFVLFYHFRFQIYENLPWLTNNEILLPLLLAVIAFITISIFVIDTEHQIIPDSLTFTLWGITVAMMILSGFGEIYHYISAGFISALFLLTIHLLTRGKGMGLGDVKLAIAFGTALGPALTVAWLFFSFIFGGIIASFFLFFGRAGLKDKIAFGPFLVISFFVMMLFGSIFTNEIFTTWF